MRKYFPRQVNMSFTKVDRTETAQVSRNMPWYHINNILHLKPIAGTPAFQYSTNMLHCMLTSMKKRHPTWKLQAPTYIIFYLP